MRVGVSQFLGHLPAVLAFDRGQQPAQIASHSAAHLGTSKARGNPSRQLSQGRRAPVDDAEVFFPCTPCPFRLFFCSHACSPPPILPSFGDKWDCSTSLRFFGNPSLKRMRPGRLLIVSTINESVLEGYLVPIIRFALL